MEATGVSSISHAWASICAVFRSRDQGFVSDHGRHRSVPQKPTSKPKNQLCESFKVRRCHVARWRVQCTWACKGMPQLLFARFVVFSFFLSCPLYLSLYI